MKHGRQCDRDKLLGTSLGLIGGKLLAMGLGFVFWLIAARLCTPVELGLATGSISAMMLVVQLALLGVGSAFILLYPKSSERPAPLFDTAITLVLMAAIGVGVVFLLLASWSFRQLSVVAAVPSYAVLFLVMSSAGSLGLLFDQMSTGLGRGEHVLGRNLLTATVTILPLGAVAVLGRSGRAELLFSFWALGGVAGAVMGLLQLRRVLPDYRYRPIVDRHEAVLLVRLGLPNHALTLAERAPGLILPVLVTEVLSPKMNAYWYVVWMMAWVAYWTPVSIGMALFAEGASRPDGMRAATDRATRSSLLLGTAVAGVIAALAGPALSLLGPSYAEVGTTPLRILLVGLVPLTFIQAYFAVCRANHRLGEAILMGAATGMAGIVITVLAGQRYGLEGMAAAWVLTQGLAALWAYPRSRVLLGRRIVEGHDVNTSSLLEGVTRP